MRRTKRMKKEEGSMGIGALIIFIALVLVAAIAAAVIIQTANHIRDSADHTSDRISQQFLGMFDVISVYGDRGASLSHNLLAISISTKVVSTSEIDLRHIAISIQTEDSVSHLFLSPAVSTLDTTYDAALSKTSSTTYSVYLPNRAVDSPWDPDNGSYNVGPNDVVVFVINLTATEQELPTHTTFQIHFSNTYTGTTSKITVTTPAGYENDDEWIRIYPPL